MFTKVLIANRGAIACRIIRTLKKMNITAVAIYAEADRHSRHVEDADEAYSLGEGNAALTYLNQDKILAIAAQTKAQAIHPGYGFLSENPVFVKACATMNITFIGPSPDSMEAFSLKHKARQLAQEHNVPLIPGSQLLENKERALAAAAELGYPLMLKSSAGGGGIGMQVCRSEAELERCFDSVVRLGENNFSDGRVFLEKYIEHARHIEVQVFGDGRGIAVHLGERDCSLQRRNQKVIEEAPAPFLEEHLRRELHETACRLLSKVNYANAGTVEFIFDPKASAFYFLEVNTRLQVEHGVTEQVYGVDLVQWMVEQAYAPIDDLTQRKAKLYPRGHAIQARVYAENPSKNFQPCAGTVSHLQWPENIRLARRTEHSNIKEFELRIDTWLNPGIDVSPFFDPMLAKVIVWAKNRNDACEALKENLENCEIYGFETNLAYAASLLVDPVFQKGKMHTRYLDSLNYQSSTIEVLSPGTMTTVQDYPGRLGYWEVGVPPSGAFDSYSFELGNRLLGNNPACSGLEITIHGPSLQFYAASQVLVAGAEIEVFLDGQALSMWQIVNVQAGQTLNIGKLKNTGARAYLLIKNGFNCPLYLGSQATFTLGQFGGHSGRALRTGDILRFNSLAAPALASAADSGSASQTAPPTPDTALRPVISECWKIQVIYGPHGAPDFFTSDDIAAFFSAMWEVHYNSSRTGIRLVGPKPEWARKSGGEAGMHPSNIHDNAYAFGSIDFTGDMPVILGPDGPSLGGFVCPATVIKTDLWKLGQLRAGDKVQFIPISLADADQLSRQRDTEGSEFDPQFIAKVLPPNSCLLKSLALKDFDVTVRPAGNSFLLVEFGEQVLDLRLRFYVYALQEKLKHLVKDGVIDLTPGIRSLQVHFDPLVLERKTLLATIEAALCSLEHIDDLKVPSRTVHLPLCWDDEACQEAVEKYQQSVRKDAPWYPSNIEFIRRINGLASIEEVKDIVFNASYVVMGLGDVYLGAPVATPLDPRHRLVTTKYNPARTWTAENSVGIGGAYLCVYGMEGPGGYQFIGRTIQMWNRYRKTEAFSQPWLLRFFDQLRFYPVSHQELMEMRENFPRGHHRVHMDHSEFSLKDYETFLEKNTDAIGDFQQRREEAFEHELAMWRQNGQFHFDSSQVFTTDTATIPEGLWAIESAVAGSVWKVLVKEGDMVEAGQSVVILESMKMEIEIHAAQQGRIATLLKPAGSTVAAGQALMYLEENH